MGQPHWCAEVVWLLLDCDDTLRRQRLTQRPGWTEPLIAEALADAQELREAVARRIDTGSHTPAQVAQLLQVWIAETKVNNDPTANAGRG